MASRMHITQTVPRLAYSFHFDCATQGIRQYGRGNMRGIAIVPRNVPLIM